MSDTLTEIRERADAIREHLADLDREEARLRDRLAAIRAERAEGLTVLAMAGAVLNPTTTHERGM